MSKTVFLALLALVCSVAAHAGHGGDMPYGWRNTRAVTASTCSTYTCAIKGGNCGDNTYCTAGEYCGAGNMCTSQVPKLLDACDASYENVCSVGSCVNSICQRVREVMPGNACTENSECFYSEVEGDNGSEGTCVGKVCFGKASGESCAASHQCNVGLYCSASTCQPLVAVNGACSSDDQCDSRLNCVASKCTAHFTVAEGNICETTNDCSAGLFCNPIGFMCERAVATTSSSVCDISNVNTDCPVGHECACRGNGQTATCAAFPGTADNMVNIENEAFACLTKNNCGTSTNSSFVDCVNSKCAKQFCTYATRSMVDLYSMPECVRARALDSASFANLLKTCSAYAPGQKSSAGVVSASMFLVALVSAVALLF